MGIRIDNWALVQAVEQVIEDTADALFPLRTPKLVYYYTRFETAQSIIRSRSIWATCLANQKNDETELQDAIRIVTDEAERLISAGISPFSEAIFEKIGAVMESRRKWNFIACFSEDKNSPHHWTTYGEYRFDISAISLRNAKFECGAFRSQQWFQPVIYDRQMQKRVIRECFDRILNLQARHISGEFGGPWMTSLAGSAARDIAQLLLRIAVSFKNQRFENDREWRLIFCPHLAVANSAPTMFDEQFEGSIKANKVRHVEVQSARPIELFKPLRLPPQPFSFLEQSSHHNSEEERQILSQLLIEHGVSEYGCERAKPAKGC